MTESLRRIFPLGFMTTMSEDLKFVADDKIKRETQDKGGKAAISLFVVRSM